MGRSRVRRILASIAVCGLVTVATTAATVPDAHAVPAGPPGTAAWQSVTHRLAPAAAAPDPAAASPTTIRRFFAGLTADGRRAVARGASTAVGNLDGAPPQLRYRANERSRVAHGDPRPAGHLMAYDTRGDGRIVEVLGDLSTARRIAVLVPGTGWGLDRVLSDRAGDNPNGPVAAARALHTRMRASAPDLPSAVVLWLGYDAPEGIDLAVIRSERAVAGGRALDRFIAGLPGRARVSLLCHSYGTVVCGRAAPSLPDRVRDIVALASPGMDVSTVARLHTRARIWAGRTPDDPIRFTPFVRVLGLGHSTDPISPRFGARLLNVDGARGHSEYFAPGTASLTNLTRIATGRTSEVTRVDHAS